VAKNDRFYDSRKQLESGPVYLCGEQLEKYQSDAQYSVSNRLIYLRVLCRLLEVDNSLNLSIKTIKNPEDLIFLFLRPNRRLAKIKICF